jgi:4-hydroxybenzoate polyprenyltransferase
MSEAKIPFRWQDLAGILVCMVAARSAAMAFNRLADRKIDARNPRTAGRTLPAGRLSRRYVWILTALSCAIFVLAAYQLNRLCLLLSLPTLAVLLGYSYSKRFTAAAHIWLGAALGIAPAGAWIAARGNISLPAIVLSAAVACWVAGFDIIYSLQDESFDRSQGLHSIPVALGGRRALLISRLLHGFSLVGFAAFAVAAGGGPYRLIAVVAAAVMLVWQHRLVSADNLRAVNAAFFTANGVLSVVMGVLFVVARLMEGRG